MDVLGNVSRRQHQFQGIMVYLNHMSLSENTAKYLFNQVLNPPKPAPQIRNSHFFPFPFIQLFTFNVCETACAIVCVDIFDMRT